MATNLQVNAQTSQAVGAFNQLAASIANARGQFNQLTAATNNASRAGEGFGSRMLRNVDAAFNILSKSIDTALTGLKLLGAGFEFVFASILRELDKLQGFNAIMSVTSKSSTEAANAYDFLRKTADKLGLQFDSLTNNYAKLVASLPEGADRMKIAEKAFLGVSMAARTLHSSNSDVQLMFYAVTQIASKGVVSMEELRRQLGEKLPGALNIAARAFNTTPELLEAAIRKGTVNSAKFLAGFGDELIRTFGDSSEKASQSVSAAVNRLTNTWVDFVKSILDSGAGQSIVNVFDALREKLSDPYLIARFTELIKSLADRFTEFISKLTADDIRNGFDSFSRFVDIAVNTFGKLIELMTWAINNAPKVGAVLGAAFGAAAGAVAGPVGMAIGAAAGGAAGVYAGRQVAPSQNDLNRTRTQNELARFQQEQKAKEQELLKFNQLIPLLQQFKGLNNLNGLDNLFKAENLNTKTLADLNSILKGKEFKTDASKVEGLRQYAKTGVVLGSRDKNLKDIIQPSNKKGPKDPLMGTLAQAGGFDRNFFTEWDNLTKLYKAGRLNLEEFTKAQGALLDKQPGIEQFHKMQKKVIEDENKATEQFIELALKEIKVREDIQNSLDTNERLAGMRTDDLRIQTEYSSILQQYESHGITLSKEKRDLILEQIQRTDKLREITAVENQIVAGTVDKYRQQVLLMQAITKLRADPTSGVTDTQITDYVVSQDPNMQGGNQYLDAQKRAMEDYFAYVDGLRKLDVINDQTAWQAKLNAQLQYDQLRLRGSSEFFSNLSGLQKSGNRKLAAIGKAAAVAQATIDAYLAINKALATIPPPLSYAVAASIGAAAFANVQGILSTKGYITGGYTGDGAATQIAGVAHGQEFVVNRSATAKNRQTLEAMNRGQTIGSNGGGVTVEIQNYGTSKNFVVDQMSPSQIRIIARDEAESVVAAKAPAIVAADMDNPNSRTSKSLARNLRASRNRG